MKKFKEYLTTKNVFVFIILLAIVLSSIIPILRFISNKPILIGDKPYYDARISKNILEKGFSFEDNKISGGRSYIAKPYHLVLASFLKFLPIDFSLTIRPFVAGLLSTILFYLLLKEFKINLKKRFFTLLILLLSPAFIYTFGTSNEFCISISLILFGTYLFLKSDRLYGISLFIFLTSAFFNMLNLLIVIFLLILLSENNYSKKKNTNLAIFFISLLSLSYYAFMYYSTNLVFRVIEFNTFRDFISDLGGIIGLSIFALILAIIGLIITWKRKQKLKKVYVLIVILFLIGLYSNHVVIYLNFIFAIFGGIAFARIVKRDWEIKILKNITILLILCGLLFSAISYTNRMILSSPDADIKEALVWLKYNSEEEALVFSHYTKGSWIEYWSDRPVLTDSLFNYENPGQKLEDSNELLYYRDLDKTKELLNKYNIKYIFVDDEMKSGQVWIKKEGLWYSFRNNETFKSVYTKNKAQIYEYILIKND